MVIVTVKSFTNNLFLDKNHNLLSNPTKLLLSERSFGIFVTLARFSYSNQLTSINDLKCNSNSLPTVLISNSLPSFASSITHCKPSKSYVVAAFEVKVITLVFPDISDLIIADTYSYQVTDSAERILNDIKKLYCRERP